MSFKNNPTGNQLVAQAGVANGATAVVDVGLQSTWWSLLITITEQAAGVAITAQGDQSALQYAVNQVSPNLFRIPLVAGTDSSVTVRITNATGFAIVYFISALLAPDNDYPAQVIGTAGKPVGVYELGGKLSVNTTFADALVHPILGTAPAGFTYAIKRVVWHAIGGTNNLLLGTISATVYSSTTGQASDTVEGVPTLGGEGLSVQVTAQPAANYGVTLFYDLVTSPTFV